MRCPQIQFWAVYALCRRSYDDPGSVVRPAVEALDGGIDVRFSAVLGWRPPRAGRSYQQRAAAAGASSADVDRADRRVDHLVHARLQTRHPAPTSACRPSTRSTDDRERDPDGWPWARRGGRGEDVRPRVHQAHRQGRCHRRLRCGEEALHRRVRRAAGRPSARSSGSTATVAVSRAAPTPTRMRVLGGSGKSISVRSRARSRRTRSTRVRPGRARQAGQAGSVDLLVGRTASGGWRSRLELR